MVQIWRVLLLVCEACLLAGHFQTLLNSNMCMCLPDREPTRSTRAIATASSCRCYTISIPVSSDSNSDARHELAVVDVYFNPVEAVSVEFNVR